LPFAVRAAPLITVGGLTPVPLPPASKVEAGTFLIEFSRVLPAGADGAPVATAGFWLALITRKAAITRTTTSTGAPIMIIALTVPEIRRLLIQLIWTDPLDPDATLTRSKWRRRGPRSAQSSSMRRISSGSCNTRSMTQSPQNPVAVIGATGQQGGAVVDELLRRGAAVRAIVRDPGSEKSRALAARGVILVLGDQDAPEGMTDALAEVRSLFFMTTYDPSTGGPEGEANRGQAVAAAAARAGVPHVVYSSVGGAERESGIPHFESKRVVEIALAESVPSSFIRPTFFMENLKRAMEPSSEREFVLRLPMRGDVPLQMVAVRDIGIVSAATLLDPGVLPGGSIEIAGYQGSGDEIARQIGEHLGKPGRFEAAPLSVLGDDTDRQAMFRWFVDTPAYQADFEATKRVDPEVLDLTAWLRSTTV
jgi:uncharacterized protein YbjT (DUF2867 family)